MKDFKIKLIAPPILYFQATHANFPFPLPYGAGVLSAFLKENNYNVVLDDLSIAVENNSRTLWLPRGWEIALNILRYEKEIIDYARGSPGNKKFEELVNRLTRTASYDLIGISVMNYYQFIFSLMLSKAIKSASCAKVVLGGPFISIYGREFFQQFSVLDYMIIGDGQVPLLGLIKSMEGRGKIEEIPGLLYRHNGFIKENAGKFFPIEDIRMPDFSDLPIDFYSAKVNDIGLILPYQISRGCTHKCCFCDRGVINTSLELKSHEKVARELENMKYRYGVNSFRFYDYNINCSYEYLDKLCDTFIGKNLDISWGAAAKTDNLDRKILHKLKESGCKFLSLGIESGSNRILAQMHKGFDAERASAILKEVYAEGIKNGIHFLVGFPHEKEEDIIETADFIRNNSEYIDIITMPGPLRVVANTGLHDDPEKYGIENLRPVFNSPLRLDFRYFAFDEISGLKWEEKLKQQGYFYKNILRANFKYILSKKFCFSLIPFRVYLWLRQRPDVLYANPIFRLLERILLPLLRRKTQK